MTYIVFGNTPSFQCPQATNIRVGPAYYLTALYSHL